MTNPRTETGEKGMTHEAGIEAAMAATVGEYFIRSGDRMCRASISDTDVGLIIQAYLTASGMVLVPREPTPVMLDSAYACGEASAAGLLEIYDMLLARAPDPFK